MHAYGHSRRDKLECRYGCCTGKSGKDRSCRKTVDRANRKSARQQHRGECQSGTNSSDENVIDSSD